MTNPNTLSSFAKHFALATGEAKLMAFNVLKKGKAKEQDSGESRDLVRAMNAAKQRTSQQPESIGPKSTKEYQGGNGGRGRGGRGDGRGRGRGRGRDQPTTDAPSTIAATKREVVDEDEYANGYTCTTTCKPNAPCRSVECTDCLHQAVSSKVKPDGNSENKRARYEDKRHNAITWTPVLGVFNRVASAGDARKVKVANTVEEGADPSEQFQLLLDSGSEHTAVRLEDREHLDSIIMYNARNKAPFVATSATGHELSVKGTGSISPAFRECYVMGDELTDNLLSCDEFKSDMYVTLVPVSAGLDWRAYIFTEEGRIVAVADDRLRVYPAFNDAMIVGIPNVVPPSFPIQGVQFTLHL